MRPVPGQKEGFSKLLTISSANIDWISKILSRTYRYSPRNLQWRDHEIYQYTLSVSLHYLVKWMYSDFASIAVAATADRVRCGRLIGTKTRLLISQENQLQICNSFNTLDSTAWYSTDPLYTAILVWRDTCWRSDWSSSQCKTHILKTVAEWCYLHLIHWWKKSSHTEKINRMTADCKHLCHQRRKPFQQNVFFSHKNDDMNQLRTLSVSVGVSTVDYHRIDIHQSRKWKQDAVLSQRGPRDAPVNTGTCRSLQRHRAVSLSQHGFLV